MSELPHKQSSDREDNLTKVKAGDVYVHAWVCVRVYVFNHLLMGIILDWPWRLFNKYNVCGLTNL